MNLPVVTIIVLNWNGWKDTIECINSLFNLNYLNNNIVVLDNGSNDGSIETIIDYYRNLKCVEYIHLSYDLKKELFEIMDQKIVDEHFNFLDTVPKKFTLIQLNENYGYAMGNNIGINYALKKDNPKYVLILNNDTVVSSEVLFKLVIEAERDSNIGILGPTILYYNYNGLNDVIHSAGAKINLIRGEAPPLYDRKTYSNHSIIPYNVDYLEGACILLSSEVISKIGLFDPKYFAYWEETDLCMRAKKNGYQIICVPSAIIWHKIEPNKDNPIKTYYLTRNMFLFSQRHLGRTQYILFLLYFFLIRLWLKLIYIIFYTRNKKILHSFLRGAYDGLKCSLFDIFTHQNLIHNEEADQRI